MKINKVKDFYKKHTFEVNFVGVTVASVGAIALTYYHVGSLTAQVKQATKVAERDALAQMIKTAYVADIPVEFLWGFSPDSDPIKFAINVVK